VWKSRDGTFVDKFIGSARRIGDVVTEVYGEISLLTETL